MQWTATLTLRTVTIATNTDTSCSVYSPVDLDLFPLLKIGENDVQFEPEFRYIGTF